ncbi:MAG: hypothetical protein ACYS0G_05620 [Planctomycetota bacterium]
MVARTNILDERLLRRRCVACGYDGALLRGGLAPRCARCSCDLQERPARSYAEMEGLLSPSEDRRTPPADTRHEERLVYRWLSFFLLAMIGFVVVVYLCTAALTI